MSESGITVYGAYWCPDCRRSKKFLGEQYIEYKWVDIEQDKSGEQYVLELNNGKRIIPTIVFPDGAFLVEPSNAELAGKLGLQTKPKLKYYDLAIIGAGPAGLTAAIYAAREGAESVIVERSGLGGQAGITQGIENFPGFPEGISGQEFADRVVQQARRFEVEILQAQDVTSLGFHSSSHCLQNSEGLHFHARAVLIAAGATYRRLGIPGEEDLIGAGIHFCATCDGPFYKGSQQILVVGGGNSACEEGLHLTSFTDKVTLLVRGDQLKASQILIDNVIDHPKIELKFHTQVEAFEGRDSKLATVKTYNSQTGEREELHPAAAFIFIGLEPNSDFTSGYLAQDQWSYILTGHDLVHGKETTGGREPLPFETSVPGVFAAGDVRHGSTKQVASAVGEGAAAALSIREYFKLI